MPFPSVTYTFTNGTLADATQVNQDFTDLINGISDGTKNISISAITAGSTATFNGNVTIGASSANTLVINASLGSSVALSSAYSFDIGADTLGLRSIYLSNSAGTHSTRLIGANVTSAWTMTLPTSAGTSRYRLETDGTGVTSWQPVRRDGFRYDNGSLSASVSANALTITYNDISGNALSATNPSDIVFRNSTSATGSLTTDTVTSNITLTVLSGATLGHGNGTNNYIFVYLLDHAGTPELAVSSTLFSEGSVQNTIAMSGSSNNAGTIYSNTTRTGVAVRLIGRMLSNQASAGTWASAPTEISCAPFMPFTGMIFPFCSPNLLGASTTYYFSCGISAASPSEQSIQIPIPFNCIATAIYANASVNPGGSITFTLRRNSADTNLSVTMPNGGNGVADTTHQVYLASGDLLSVKVATGVGASNLYVTGSILILRV